MLLKKYPNLFKMGTFCVKRSVQAGSFQFAVLYQDDLLRLHFRIEREIQAMCCWLDRKDTFNMSF